MIQFQEMTLRFQIASDINFNKTSETVISPDCREQILNVNPQVNQIIKTEFLAHGQHLLSIMLVREKIWLRRFFAHFCKSSTSSF